MGEGLRILQNLKKGEIMSSYITKKTDGDTAWFEHDRFGMFIHFGLYSAGGVHEWCKTAHLVSDER